MSDSLARVTALLRRILPADAVLDDAAARISYGYDNSRHQARPDLVVLPRSRDEVVATVRACAEHRLALTARGRGTNTTGASIPLSAGVVLSFERMNRILEVDPDDRVAVVEPGVLNGDLQVAAAAHRLFFAPDPTSAAFSTLGGNLACNAGGPRAVKYGASRDNVLALDVIDGLGRFHRLGSRTTKGATGYDLTRLMVGSEGTLGLIVAATLKLTPMPEAIVTLRALYDDVESAARAVARLMRQPAIPCAVEFMDGAAIQLARDIGGADLPAAGALLMLEVDGQLAALPAAVAAVRQAALGGGCIAVEQADDPDAVKQLWAARKALSPALKHVAPRKINEDVVVPVSRLPELVRATQRIATQFGLRIVCFGHAGNGNLHVNLMYDPAVATQADAAPQALREVFQAAVDLGGMLSGEHGIGIEKRDFMPLAIAAETLGLMHEIKRCFDPLGILNPGKLLPDRQAIGTL